MLFNLHTHTHFSDGSSAPEEYLKESLRQGFSVLGFSDHSPVPFENNFAIKEERLDEYCEAIRDLTISHGPSPGGEKQKEQVHMKRYLNMLNQEDQLLKRNS